MASTRPGWRKPRKGLIDVTDPEPQAPQSEAGTASAEQGIVVLDGPDGGAVSIDPDPAEETGRRLIEAAKQAREQGSGGA